MKCIYRFLLLLFATIGSPEAKQVQGGQFKQLGDLEVHYIAFPSTFLQPNIAKHYGLDRSANKAVLNISALAMQKNRTPQRVTLNGTAKNLLGNKVSLVFNEVVEGDAIYYLASVNYRNEETYIFDITVGKDSQKQTFRFQKTFYVD